MAIMLTDCNKEKKICLARVMCFSPPVNYKNINYYITLLTLISDVKQNKL